MSPEQSSQRAALRVRIEALIAHGRTGARDDTARDALLLDLASYQTRWVAPYARFAAQRARRDASTALERVPALPTDAFRFARISSRDAADDVRVFESSGTTSDTRSRHAFQDLSLYDLAAHAAAKHMLFPDVERMPLVILAPTATALATSSLSYMLGRFLPWFGTAESQHVFAPEAEGDASVMLRQALAPYHDGKEPVAVLGTSFAFVHAIDALKIQRFRLAPGSRIMQTGGFKGRSREIAPEAMRSMLSETFGVPAPFIVAEYGMTELSSQLYETTLRDALCGPAIRPRRLWAPGWLRAVPVHPEALTPCALGEDGLLRLDDAANLDSVAFIQTADVGVLDRDGLILRGRAPGAVARGCSIQADELLLGGRP